ncbi:MAG: S9 family peptidase [Longimicrobiales bacterium]|nr:S9 family peptidase [Longimicrobiales bacterium]
MTTDDVLEMVRVGGAVMSPGGDWVLFSRSELDWEENERKTTWWRVPADGSEEPYRFIGEDGGSSPRFSPDGRWLAFLRSVDDERQLFLMRTDGGEALQLSEHETSIGSYSWTDDGEAIVFVAEHAPSEEEEEAEEKGYDAIYVDEGPNGQRAGEWNDLWRIDVETKEETRLTEREHRIGSFDVSPDGRWIAFAARDENRRNQQYLSEIHLLDVQSGELRELTSNLAPESRLTWSPDGRRLAYEAPSDDEWELRLDKLWTMDVETGETRMISGAFEGSIRDFVWTPDGSDLLFGGLQRTNTNLYRLDVSSGAVTRLTDHVGSLSPESFSRDRTSMAYTLEDWDTPPDIWAGATDGSPGRRLTQANPWIEDEIQLAESRLMRWESRDGLEIEGILTLPADDAPGADPLLLHIHGGPAGVFRNAFDARRHVWAGLGYVQLAPNVRGSSGYSDELLRGNMFDIGGGDYHDLMTGVDAVVAEGIADPEHLALRGWSYGGILGGWTITQTDRFDAASLGAMVSDWTSEYGPGFNHDVSLWYIGGTPWENPEAWRERSPLTHVANVTTPTILFHGMNDRTDTEPQSMMFFQALKDQGKTVRYLRFPREGHGIREPRHQRTRDIEEIRWIQRHARGIDWEPWTRPEKKSEPEVVS